jgi:hypothetical protein
MISKISYNKKKFTNEELIRLYKALLYPRLIEEKMLIEGSMTFEIEKENYVILFGYHEEPLLPTTEKEINIKHKATKKECLEYVGKINPGYFVEQ